MRGRERDRKDGGGEIQGRVPPSSPPSFLPSLPSSCRARIPPASYFRETCGDRYSQFDDAGFPLVDARGEALSKAVQKKLAKEWEQHKKAHAKLEGKEGV